MRRATNKQNTQNKTATNGRKQKKVACVNWDIHIPHFSYRPKRTSQQRTTKKPTKLKGPKLVGRYKYELTYPTPITHNKLRQTSTHIPTTKDLKIITIKHPTIPINCPTIRGVIKTHRVLLIVLLDHHTYRPLSLTTTSSKSPEIIRSVQHHGILIDDPPGQTSTSKIKIILKPRAPVT